MNFIRMLLPETSRARLWLALHGESPDLLPAKRLAFARQLFLTGRISETTS